MVGKVANYNTLKREADGLRARYQNLQAVVNQKNDQLATLQIYAKEVSLAFGIKQKLEGPADITAEGKLAPSFAESVEDYDFLKRSQAVGAGRKDVAGISAVSSTPEPLAGRWPPDREQLRAAHRSVLG